MRRNLPIRRSYIFRPMSISATCSPAMLGDVMRMAPEGIRVGANVRAFLPTPPPSCLGVRRRKPAPLPTHTSQPRDRPAALFVKGHRRIDTCRAAALQPSCPFSLQGRVEAPRANPSPRRAPRLKRADTRTESRDKCDKIPPFAGTTFFDRCLYRRHVVPAMFGDAMRPVS